MKTIDYEKNANPNITSAGVEIVNFNPYYAIVQNKSNSNVILTQNPDIQSCLDKGKALVIEPGMTGCFATDTIRNRFFAYGNGDIVISGSDKECEGILLATQQNHSKLNSRLAEPNLLINSNFAINQRASAEYTATNYAVDCWQLWKQNSVVTAGTMTVSDKGVKLATAGNAFDTYLRQYIENGANLVGKTVTLSFKATEITGTWGVGQQNNESPSITSIDDGVISISFVWTEQPTYSIQFFNRSADATLKLEWVKLEIGNTATKYQTPSIPEELLKCQRFYQLHSAGDIAEVDLRPSMSSTPKIVMLDNGYYSYAVEV